jgi:CheY-like chemotaxis protein
MGPRILVVENDRIIAEYLRDLIAELGYAVTATVATGQDAITHADENPPDLVLMDIRLKSDMDGAQVAQVLRQRFNVHVVYLSTVALLYVFSADERGVRCGGAYGCDPVGIQVPLSAQNGQHLY